MWGEGTVLAGRYQLRQRIGGGSMGDVWRALDTVLGREVAVKILLPALLDDAGFAARFHTEARVLAALSHPGIVSVFDYGETDDPRTAFLVMELISGRPLSDLLDESAPLSEATTLTVVAQTLEALQAAHDQGIVHRDVKPANLMLRGGSVVVTDFGVARTADARRLTAADVVLGTAVYAAPEQARHTAVTAAADQYAVGVIAYECLTGTPPFDSGTPLGIMMKHLQEPVPPLPDTVSAPVRELVMRALAKDPAERFASAREMAETARRLAALPASVTRIGLPQDSFQVGVDVAAVAAAAEGARADGDFLSFTVVPQESVVDQDEGDADEAAAEAAGLSPAATKPAGVGDGAAAGPVGEASPAWASYAVRPSAEGTDWASFTVRGSQAVEASSDAGVDGEKTVPLPDAEGDVELAPSETPGGEERDSRRMVPQDSFMVGVAEDGEAVSPGAQPTGRRGRLRGRFGRAVPQEAAGGGTAPRLSSPAGGRPAASTPAAVEADTSVRAVPQDSFTAGIPADLAHEAVGSAESAESAEPAAGSRTSGAEEPAARPAGSVAVGESATGAESESEPDLPRGADPAGASTKEIVAHIAPGHAMPLNSFTAGVDLDPSDFSEPAASGDSSEPADSGARSVRVVPQDSFTVLDPDSPDNTDDPENPDGPDGPDVPTDLTAAPGNPRQQAGRRRAVVLAAVGAVVVIAVAVAYPLSHGRSSASASGVVAATQGSSSGAGSTSASAVSITSVVSETSTIVVTSSVPSPSGKPPSSSAGAPPTEAGKTVSSGASGPASASRSSAPSAGASSVSAPPPVLPSTSAVPHKSGYITNVGDGDAIDVFGNSSGAPIYNDGAQLTVEPQAGRTGQSFQATALTANGQTVYEFGDGLDTNQLVGADASGGGKVTLLHCGCGSPNQYWWLTRDASMPGGAYYLNNQGAAGQCLTDNGPSNPLSLTACVAGNKAQQWYLP